jgi:UDP-N-acetylmuramoyl-tripeptide--D-alanyl-D-alanine ligase
MNFLRQLASRYRPRYIRSLIYMLQSCEYAIGDYLAWYARTKDFGRVEIRKTLVKTKKAYLLYACAYAMIIAALALAYILVPFAETPSRILVVVCAFLLTPYILAYVIILPLMVANALQAPIEFMLIGQARKRLSVHKGLKIAIAGSFGKTSMREILKTVLSERRIVASPPFSYNTPLGIAGFVGRLTGNEEVLIFELGEYHPGDIKELCEVIDPHIGIITGVNEAHLEKFGTLERTARTVFELADYLKDKPVYINGENAVTSRKANHKLKNHIIYTREGTGDFRIRNARSDLSGTSFVMEIDGNKFSVKSRLLGLHSVGPLSVAAHIAHRLGFMDKQIRSGITKTIAFSHRLEASEDKNGVITIDDSYNGNPDGVRAIIDFLSSIKDRRRWYVTPGLVEMGARTVEVHKEIGRRLALAGIEKVVLIKNSVTPYIEQGLKESGYSGEIVHFDGALSAYAALPHLTVKRDVVLLQNDWPDQYA